MLGANRQARCYNFQLSIQSQPMTQENRQTTRFFRKEPKTILVYPSAQFIQG